MQTQFEEAFITTMKVTAIDITVGAYNLDSSNTMILEAIYLWLNFCGRSRMFFEHSSSF